MVTDTKAAALLTVKDVAGLLAISESAVRELCAAKQIDHFRVGVNGGRYRFRREAIDAYLEKTQVVQPTIQPGRVRRQRKTPVASGMHGLTMLRAGGWKG